MRISDWSSDVCSSDLSLRIDRKSVRGAVAGYAIIIADWTCRPFRAHQTIGGDQIIVEAVPKLSMRLEPVLQHLFARPLERACRDVAAVGDIAVVLQQDSGSGVARQHDISAILNSQPAFLVRISAQDVRSEERRGEK